MIELAQPPVLPRLRQVRVQPHRYSMLRRLRELTLLVWQCSTGSEDVCYGADPGDAYKTWVKHHGHRNP